MLKINSTFYPEILEAVVFGAGKDRCMAFINIDLTAVGNWAERNNIAYASYQELSQNPLVLDMIEKNVAKVNQHSIAEDDNAIELPDPSFSCSA